MRQEINQSITVPDHLDVGLGFYIIAYKRNYSKKNYYIKSIRAKASPEYIFTIKNDIFLKDIYILLHVYVSFVNFNDGLIEVNSI